MVRSEKAESQSRAERVNDRPREHTGLIARAIWDYWNLGSTKRLGSVLRSGSPLSDADRELLADFIEFALRQTDNCPIIDESVTGSQQLRPSEQETERIKIELRTRYREAAGIGDVQWGPERRPGTKAADSEDELAVLLRRLKNKQKNITE